VGLTQLGRKNAKVAPMLAKLLDDEDRSARAGRERLWATIGYAKSRRAREEARATGSARAVLRRAEPGQAQGREGDAPLLALLKRNDNRIRICGMRPRTRWRASARTPRSTPVCRTLPPPCAWACVLAYRELRDAEVAWFLERLGCVRGARARSAINDAPVEARIRARREARRRADQRRAVRGARHQRQLPLGAAATRRRWRSTPRATRQRDHARRSAAAARLWGKTPQRDRIVGIYRPLPARRPSRRRGAGGRSAQGDGQRPGSVQLRALEAIGNLKSGEADADAVAPWRMKAPEAVRVGALKALDAFGGDA
jgi:hypothetical protein